MKYFKQNIFAALFVVCVMFSFISTAYAATGSYNFTMDASVVNGKTNGVYYTLNAGKVYIDGEHWVVSDDIGALDRNNTITYVLYRDRLGFDVNCGSFSCTIEDAVHGYLGEADISSSKYYLYITKLDDGHNIAGSGYIFNE